MTSTPYIDLGQRLEVPKAPAKPRMDDFIPVPERAQEIASASLGDLFSACDPEFSAMGRIDPFWDGVWASGSSEASWISRSLAERQVAAGLGRLPSALDIPRETAIARVTADQHRRRKHGVLAAVDTWRTLSTEQLACIIGDSAVRRYDSKAVSSMFAAELLDLGVLHSMLSKRDTDADRATLLRPSASTVFASEIEPTLTYPEWVSITGGYPFQSGSQYDRHNLLATELGLRIAEYCEVGSVLGEKHSTVDLLAGSGVGLPFDGADQRRADLVALRPDGLRIAVEVTASHGNALDRKIRRWAELLQDRPMEVCGLVVLFVIAAPPERERLRGSKERTKVYKSIAKAVAEFPGSVGNLNAERMGVISWRDWFPGRLEASPDFINLSADFPVGGPGEPLWQRRDLLGGAAIELEVRDPDRLKAAVSQSHLLRGVPHWLREPKKAPQVWPTLLSRVGMTEIPYSMPDPKRRQRTQRPGTPPARVAKTMPPPRLLID